MRLVMAVTSASMRARSPRRRLSTLSILALRPASTVLILAVRPASTLSILAVRTVSTLSILVLVTWISATVS